MMSADMREIYTEMFSTPKRGILVRPPSPLPDLAVLKLFQMHQSGGGRGGVEGQGQGMMGEEGDRAGINSEHYIFRKLLKDEYFDNILSFLDGPRQLATVMLVCRKFYALANRKNVWVELCLRFAPLFPIFRNETAISHQLQYQIWMPCHEWRLDSRLEWAGSPVQWNVTGETWPKLYASFSRTCVEALLSNRFEATVALRTKSSPQQQQHQQQQHHQQTQKQQSGDDGGQHDLENQQGSVVSQVPPPPPASRQDENNNNNNYNNNNNNKGGGEGRSALDEEELWTLEMVFKQEGLVLSGPNTLYPEAESVCSGMVTIPFLLKCEHTVATSCRKQQQQEQLVGLDMLLYHKSATIPPLASLSSSLNQGGEEEETAILFQGQLEIYGGGKAVFKWGGSVVERQWNMYSTWVKNDFGRQEERIALTLGKLMNTNKNNNNNSNIHHDVLGLENILKVGTEFICYQYS